ncbi:Protein kinase domain/Protein tyrosine kinase, putative [Angomonas deanei]|uniref:Protein kinase domain/Protein tyrosine kinase, putative n=1 Tax=Angomonas deanei TaxID=59799 RepID=A0A7G2C2H6_9TRYP|nr:Protein kinase domain/Protein tyrosine kinase, putative [Angomonas deanei]
MRTSRFVLREIFDLRRVFNGAMSRVGDLEQFLPQAQRIKWFRGDSSQDTVSWVSSYYDSATTSLQPVFTSVVYVTTSIKKVRVNEERQVGDLDHNPMGLVSRSVQRVPTQPQLDRFFRVLFSAAEQNHGVALCISPDECVFQFGASVAGGAAKAKENQKKGAIDAARFALAVSRRLRKSDVGLCARLLVDSCMYTQGTLAVTSSTNLFVSSGRSVMHDIREVVDRFSPWVVLVTEETRPLVDDVVQLWPSEYVSVHRTKFGEPYVVTLYEAHGKLPLSALWCEVCSRSSAAFGLMQMGYYHLAQDELWKVKYVMDDYLEMQALSEDHTTNSSRTNGGVPAAFLERIEFFCTVCAQKYMTCDQTPFILRPLSLRYRYLLHQVFDPPATHVAALPDDASLLQFPLLSITECPAPSDAVPAAPKELNQYEFRCVQRIHWTDQVVFASRPADSIKGDFLKLRLSRVPSEDRSQPLYRQEYTVISSTGETYRFELMALRYPTKDMLYYLKEHKDLQDPTRAVDEEERALRLVAPEGSYVARVNRNDLPPVPSWWSGVEQEVRWLFPLGMESSHFLHVYEVFCSFHGGCSLVTDEYAGGSLRDVTEVYGRTPASVALQYMESILTGLVDLHERFGRPHGFLEPRNVLVGVSGQCVMRGHFTDYRRARELLFLQDTYYLSPEVARGEAPTTASDMFSLGLMLQEMLTGVAPWAWSPLEMRTDHELQSLLAAPGAVFCDYVQRGILVVAPVTTEVDTHLKNVMDHCLVMDPDQRWTAEQCLSALAGHNMSTSAV